MPATEVVIVSGAEYAKYEPAAGDTWVLRTFSPSIWIQIARNWAAQEFRTPDTTVTVFDIARGTQETSADGKAWKRVQTLEPPTAAEWWRITDNRPGRRRYERPVSPFTTKDREATHVAYLPGSAIPPNRVALDDSYRPVGGPRLGMQDVYNYICRIGLTRPGTLRGLHLFAHADEDGPILLNTWSPAPHDPGRGLLDIDARAHQDFTTANIPRVSVPDPFRSDADRDSFIATNPRTRSGFNSAWSEDTTAVVWGCLGDHFVKEFVEQVAAQLAQAKAKAAKRPGTKMPADPAITIRANVRGSLGEEDRAFWAAFFGLNPASGIPTTIVKPLSWVKQKLIALNHEAYPGQLGSALGAGTTFPRRRVLAAPLGASTWVKPADRDRGVNALMRVVPREFDTVLGLYQGLGFVYALDLADTTSPFGRGYGQFPPAAATP
ncbi:hypothetical protein ABZT17_09805 [Streptomyces sp. NPDC005648]|uniref:hypothetical protein n=1 Tax=Streptomyces sp. NPDC005648 TaxID=3157044 RepID=UPI0033B967C7